MPEAALGYWTHRLVEQGVPHEAPEKRFGETVLTFTDPDGMRLGARRRCPAPRARRRGDARFRPKHAIRGFHGVTLLLADAAIRPARS